MGEDGDIESSLGLEEDDEDPVQDLNEFSLDCEEVVDVAKRFADEIERRA